MASRARLRQAKQPHGDRTPCALKQSHSHAWRSSLQLIPDWCQRLRPRSVLCLRSLCRCPLLSFPRSDPRLCLLLPCRLFAVRPSFSPNSNTHCISGRWGSGSATHFSRSDREGGEGRERATRTKGWRESRAHLCLGVHFSVCRSLWRRPCWSIKDLHSIKQSTSTAFAQAGRLLKQGPGLGHVALDKLACDTCGSKGSRHVTEHRGAGVTAARECARVSARGESMCLRETVGAQLMPARRACGRAGRGGWPHSG